MGDATGKGGALVFGFPAVLIGDKTNGGGGAGAAPVRPDCMRAAAEASRPFVRG